MSASTEANLSPVPSGGRTLPNHVAIIMDGNYRWAKRRGSPAIRGHRAGAENVRTLLKYYVKYYLHSNMKVLTLFAFSSENWQRPSREVSDLWGLFSGYLDSEMDELLREGVRLRFIGNRERLSERLRRQMTEAEERSLHTYRDNTLVLAVDYGGRWDIVNAMRNLATEVASGDCAPDEVDEHRVGQYLALGDLPDPDLCIRTGGEQRVSNFLLWQLAYAEFYFSDVLWPDFSAAHFEAALDVFYERQRRFGARAKARS